MMEGRSLVMEEKGVMCWFRRSEVQIALGLYDEEYLVVSLVRGLLATELFEMG